ncbi:MAG: outer-membrane lipoprotein carrier protein LolA, partial [Limnobacter sp.]|nr:outer-membrane lipoprotein carrier protein LolA [Limnobacter sp.]
MNRKWLTLPLLLASGLLFMSFAWADSAKHTLEQFNREVSQASGRFKQVVITPEGRVKQEGQGEFSFSKPGQFRWEIKTPFPQIIVSDGQSV